MAMLYGHARGLVAITRRHEARPLWAFVATAGAKKQSGSPRKAPELREPSAPAQRHDHAEPSIEDRQWVDSFRIHVLPKGTG